jgi:N-methylhydantoinase B/oxoprolinase/acetone carboxylase alpha subunit
VIAYMMQSGGGGFGDPMARRKAKVPVQVEEEAFEVIPG